MLVTLFGSCLVDCFIVIIILILLLLADAQSSRFCTNMKPCSCSVIVSPSVILCCHSGVVRTVFSTCV